MSKSQGLLALVFLGSIALLPVASLADAVINPDIPSICDAVAGNLVKNCGFETGNLTDWTSTPSPVAPPGGFAVTVPAQAHSGFHAATPTSHAPISLPDRLSQVISDTAGQSFDTRPVRRDPAPA